MRTAVCLDGLQALAGVLFGPVGSIQLKEFGFLGIFVVFVSLIASVIPFLMSFGVGILLSFAARSPRT